MFGTALLKSFRRLINLHLCSVHLLFKVCFIRGFKKKKKHKSDLIADYIKNSEANMLNMNTALVSTFLWTVSLHHYTLHLHALYRHCALCNCLKLYLWLCVSSGFYKQSEIQSPLRHSRSSPSLSFYSHRGRSVGQSVLQIFTHPSFIHMIVSVTTHWLWLC